MLSFFTYGHVFTLIWSFRVFTDTLHVHVLLTAVVVIALTIGTTVIVRSGDGFGRVAAGVGLRRDPRLAVM